MNGHELRPADSPPKAAGWDVSRGSTAVASGILLSRLAGLVRESLMRAVLGLGPAADAFAAALRIPNLLQNLLGEGSLSASFIPVYSRLLGEGRRDEAGRVAAAVAGLLASLAGGLAVVAILAARPLATVLAPGFEGARLNLTVDLIRITTGGLGLLVLSAWCLGVLNSHGRFFLPYVAPVLWNVAQIAVLVAALTGDWSPTRAATGLAWGLVVGGALQFGVQAVGVRRLAPELRPWIGRTLGRGDPSVTDIRRRFGPAVLGRGALQISGYLDLVLASLLATGAVAGLLSAQMLYGLPVALFASSVAAAALPKMSQGSTTELAAASLRARQRSAFFVVFSSLSFLTLGESIVGALFGWGVFDGDDALAVSIVLAAYSLGLPAISSSRIHQNSLYAAGDTKGPAQVAAVRVCLAATIGLVLMFPMDRLAIHAGEFLTVTDGGWFGPLSPGIRSGSPDPHLGAAGLALGSAVAAWAELGLLARRTRRTFGAPIGPSPVMSNLVAPAASAIVIAVVARWTTGDLPAVAAAPIGLAAAGAVYVAVAAATGVTEAQTLMAKVRRLIRR